jgi:hypothetical protein
MAAATMATAIMAAATMAAATMAAATMVMATAIRMLPAIPAATTTARTVTIPDRVIPVAGTATKAEMAVTTAVAIVAAAKGVTANDRPNYQNI